MTDLARISTTLQGIVRKIKTATSDIDRLTGQKDAVLEQLKAKYSVSTAVDADTLLQQKIEERKQLEQQLSGYVEELNAFFNRR
jgi:hypothetical protein